MPKMLKKKMSNESLASGFSIMSGVSEAMSKSSMDQHSTKKLAMDFEVSHVVSEESDEFISSVSDQK